jgi:ADP-heptose:LPS heptosyltransferase
MASPGIKHILVIRLSAMGDVAMTVPLLRAFSFQYPDTKVTVVSKAFCEPFFSDIPNVSFFAADTNGRHKGFMGLFRLYSDIRKLRINAVADLHNVLRSKVVTLLFALSGKKTATTDKARAEKKALTRIKKKVFRPLLPVAERHAVTFKKLGFPVNLNNPVFPAVMPLSKEAFHITGWKREVWIGIAPFAQHEGKVYPADLMQQVIAALAKNKCKLFLFGGGSIETELLTAFAKGKQNAVVVAGKLTLQQELGLISNLDVMLSMDSGNGHIAAMLGVKVVTLYGATHPYAGFAPFNQPADHALVADRDKFPLLPTSVYGNKKIEGYEDAMRTITPESVVHKIYEILNK